MCRPDHYGIEYEINPWMHKAAADQKLALAQWESLVALFRALGAEIELLDPMPGLPDMVFTANAGLIYNGEFIPSRFRHAERQGETPCFVDWMNAHGFHVVDVNGDCGEKGSAFEGAGDALFVGETLVAGYLNRSDIGLHRHLASRLQRRVISVELVDPYFYHLDTCFCPLSREEAIYYPPAFDEYGRKALEQVVPRLLAVNETEARRFACNAAVIGKTVVTNTGCPKLSRDLESMGYAVRATDLSEFLKSGGSAKCLTLRLDGEEAADW